MITIVLVYCYSIATQIETSQCISFHASANQVGVISSVLICGVEISIVRYSYDSIIAVYAHQS